MKYPPFYTLLPKKSTRPYGLVILKSLAKVFNAMGCREPKRYDRYNG